MITEETIARMKQNLEVKNEFFVLDVIKHLETQIEELKKDKEWLEKTDNEQTDLILKLCEQIEKMKCCGNCKHYKQINNYLVGTCKGKYDVEGNNICDKWEK